MEQMPERGKMVLVNNELIYQDMIPPNGDGLALACWTSPTR